MPLTLDGTAGMTAPQGAVYNGLATATVQNSTSGTSIDFTGIPLWVKRITVMFSSVSLSSSAHLLVQLGSGSVTTSGYTAVSSRQGGTDSTTNVTSTSGFPIASQGSSASFNGALIINTLTNNVWVASGSIQSGSTYTSTTGGTVTLSGTLDRVRIANTSTDTFDAGTINIMYE